MRTLYSLWKKTIIILMSFMMVNINLQIDQQQIAHNNSIISMQSSHVFAADDAQQTKSLSLEGGDGNFLNSGILPTLIFMALGYVIYKSMMQCGPQSPDLILAAGGAIIYLAGELMAIFKSGESMDAKTINYKALGDDGNISESDYAALEAEKQSLKDVKDAADTKAKLQQAAAVVFLGAAIASGVMMTADTISVSACTGQCKAAGIAASASCIVCAQGALSHAVVTKVPNLSTMKFKTLKLAETGFETGSLACLAENKAKLAKCAAAAGGCAATPVGKLIIEATAAAGAAKGACSTAVATTSLSEMLCVTLPPAAAATGPLAFLAPIGEVVDSAINLLITSPGWRTTIWGLAATYAYMAYDATQSEADAAEENMKKIDRILKKMDNSRGKVTASGTNVTASGIGMGVGDNLALMEKPIEIGANVPCATKDRVVGGDGIARCPEVKMPKTTMKTKDFGITDGAGFVNNTLGALNGIQGNSKITPETMAKINALGAQSNAMKKAFKDRLKKMDQVSKKLLGKPYNYDKKVKDLENKLLKSASNKLASMGMTPQQAWANVGSGASLLSGSVDDRVKELTPGKDSGGQAAGGDGLDLSVGKTEIPEFNFETDIENADEIVDQVEKEHALNQAMANADMEVKDDIVLDKNVSIFKVITIRYFKSGFKKLLEEEKPSEE
jgi:hypothetical protein